MTNKFAVKSNSFALYKAFKEEVEKLGWEYNNGFNVFTEENMNYHNCLYFCETWNKVGDYKFSISNTGTGLIFNLGKQWDEALDYAGRLISLKKEKDKNYYVTISELVTEFAENRGIDKDLVVIKH